MGTLTAKKHWFVVGNNWHLMVDVSNRVFHETVIVYDTSPGFESALETNKKIKEGNLVEKIKKELGLSITLI